MITYSFYSCLWPKGITRETLSTKSDTASYGREHTFSLMFTLTSALKGELEVVWLLLRDNNSFILTWGKNSLVLRPVPLAAILFVEIKWRPVGSCHDTGVRERGIGSDSCLNSLQMYGSLCISGLDGILRALLFPSPIYRCRGLKLIETFTAKAGDQLELPNFLDIEKEVTDDPSYSMYWLALKDTSDGVNGGQDNGTRVVNGGDEVGWSYCTS